MDHWTIKLDRLNVSLSKYSQSIVVCTKTKLCRKLLLSRQPCEAGLWAFCNNRSCDIVMCNHNIISGNETNMSKLSCKVSAYYVLYSGNGSISKSLNVESNFFHTNLSTFFYTDLNCHQILCFNATDLKILIFSARSISSIHKN